MRPCFAFSAAPTDDAPATLSIYDEIGFWGVQAKDFIASLAAVTAKTINVEINSPGGDVFAGLAIYNGLKSSGKEIVVKVMGVAASAASLVAMAGDKIIMPKNTFMMVHNPWGVAMGNAEDMREQAGVLDKIGAALLATYVAKTGLPDDEVAAMLATDTWLTADEALEKGFATEVSGEIKAKAAFDMNRADLPAAVKAIYATAKDAPALETVVQVVEAATAEAESEAEAIVVAANAAGLQPFAAYFALHCKAMSDAAPRIAAAKSICFLCKTAGRPDDAAPAIRANKSADEVRAELIVAMAEEDASNHTSNVRKVQAGAGATGAGSGVSTESIWASHDKQTKARKG